jgi:hypothetical protein
MKTDRAFNRAALVVARPIQILVPYLFKVLIATLLLLALFNRQASAQCVAPTLTFNSPKLLSGTDGTIGAVYLFAEVIPGVDCHVEIMDIVGGAGLTEIDNITQGYYDAFQPYVWAGGYDTSYLDWKFTFKVGGTYTDTTLACLAVTAVDVDGNSKDQREFVEAATPGSFAVDPFTNLIVSFDGVRSRAEGQVPTIMLIDTAQRQAMFQMNFTNINSLLYKNGSISTGDGMTRHTCIYFKPFFPNWVVLPTKLLSFTAKEQSNGVLLNWSATNEQDTKSYTVQKSVDGKIWKDVRQVSAAYPAGVNKYSAVDAEKSNGVVYYRLKQIDVRGFGSYSKVIKTGAVNVYGNDFSHNTIFNSTIQMQVKAPAANEYQFEIYNSNGQKLIQQRTSIHNGMNTVSLQLPASIAPGIYLMSVKDNSGKFIYHSKIFKN